jgi:hypothetical protein
MWVQVLEVGTKKKHDAWEAKLKGMKSQVGEKQKNTKKVKCKIN